jgi:hypothetical protein
LALTLLFLDEHTKKYYLKRSGLKASKFMAGFLPAINCETSFPVIGCKLCCYSRHNAFPIYYHF